MAKRTTKSTAGGKACDYCGQVVTCRYRIQYQAGDQATQHWSLVCPDCQSRLREANPHYRYGGTWKAR